MTVNTKIPSGESQAWRYIPCGGRKVSAGKILLYHVSCMTAYVCSCKRAGLLYIIYFTFKNMAFRCVSSTVCCLFRPVVSAGISYFFTVVNCLHDTKPPNQGKNTQGFVFKQLKHQHSINKWMHKWVNLMNTKRN